MLHATESLKEVSSEIATYLKRLLMQSTIFVKIAFLMEKEHIRHCYMIVKIIIIGEELQLGKR